MAAKVERLVNVTIALLEARRPLTFEELRSRTGYYTQADHESARRMFERDKDDLRRLGVPVETRPVDAFEAELGYVVDRRDYELEDVDLDAEEVTALALALQVGGDATSRMALAKVGARAPDPGPASELAARVELDAGQVDDLAESLLVRRPVRFAYRAASGERARRSVDPYAVVYRRGAWYVVGRDHDRDDLRVFRLDRVEGRIERAGEPGSFEPPPSLDPAAVIDTEHVAADVAVAATAVWEAELHGGVATGRSHRGWAVYHFAGASPWRLSAWVLGLGPAAEVLAPATLRDEVVRRLEAIAERP